MEPVTRREFISTVLGACATCAAAAAVAAETTGPATGVAAPKPVEVGSVADYAKDGLYASKLGSAGVFIVRENGKLYALAGQCTHKRGKLKVDPANPKQIACTKHEGFFGADGKVVSGPPKSALPRLSITKGADGKLTVDKSVQFGAADWDKPGAFVAV